MHAQDCLAAFQVGIADDHLAVETSRPQQRRIEDVLPVGRGEYDDPLVGGEAVHLDEQLVEGLLALLMAERAAAAAAAHRIELVDEDDARLVAPRVLEQLADAGGAHAGVHLDEVGTARKHERHARLSGYRARQQRLACTRRPDQQHAFRDAPAN